jgi:hypothetical protein
MTAALFQIPRIPDFSNVSSLEFLVAQLWPGLSPATVVSEPVFERTMVLIVELVDAISVAYDVRKLRSSLSHTG